MSADTLLREGSRSSSRDSDECGGAPDEPRRSHSQSDRAAARGAHEEDRGASCELEQLLRGASPSAGLHSAAARLDSHVSAHSDGHRLGRSHQTNARHCRPTRLYSTITTFILSLFAQDSSCSNCTQTETAIVGEDLPPENLELIAHF